MTVDDVRARVAHIAAIASDYEAAHIEEDKLHVEVLEAIVGGYPNARELAQEALRTRELDFARYCA